MGKDPVWVVFFTIGVLLLGVGLYRFYGERRSGPAIVMVVGLGFAALGGVGMGMVDVVSNAIAPGRDGVGMLGGVWANEDVRTGSITRVEIRSRWPGIEVKMWGRCQPTDCDWGSPSSYDRSAAASGQMNLVWRPRFAVKNQDLKLLPDGRLEIVTHTHFTDNSRRRDYDSKDYFRKVAAQ
jgi:hypothetical protein